MNKEIIQRKIIYPKLSSNIIVYRTLWSNGIDDDTQTPTEEGYKLRYIRGRGAYEKEMSFKIAQFCSLEKCIEQFPTCQAIAQLEVEKIRELGLDIIQDKEDHAAIKGIPNEEENRKEAIRIALLLANISEIIWTKES